MGLYLCIFDGDEEIDGVEIGAYSDFSRFRVSIANLLEDGQPGSKYPVLQNHSGADGEWSPNECYILIDELTEIAEAFKTLPPIKFEEKSWQDNAIKSGRVIPKNLYDSFFDVNKEPLIERLIDLCQKSQKHNLPILFQ